MSRPRRALLSFVLCLGLSRPAAAQAPPDASAAPDTPPAPALTVPRLRWGADFSFAGILDESLRGSLGRER